MDIRVVGYEALWGFPKLIDLTAPTCDPSDAQLQVAPVTAFLFELLVPLSLGFFTFVALGDPGTVPARPQGNSAVEELMKVIDSPAGDIEPPDINRLCTTTWVMKGLRTKYCVQTGACVEEFDHYCVWLNNTIGKANHRQFVGLAIVEFFTQVTHVRLCMVTVMSLIPYQSFTQWMWGAITSYPLLTMIVVIHCVTAPWVLMLTLHQSRLVLMNLTTNEMMNMHRYEHFWTIRQIGPGADLVHGSTDPSTDIWMDRQVDR
ncbi:PAT24 [Symbiodinium sp. CCMP2592]|nr:PAT24 [Symbiodinium sp. CCMP2592]